MKNKLWLLLLIPVLIFSGFGCVSTDAPAGESLASQLKALQDTVTKHTSVIDSVKADMEKKATKTEIDDLTRKVNNLPQSSATPADVYTKAQVNQAIADAIDKLKADKPWGTYTTPAGTIAGDYGELIDTDGDLELWLEKTSGIATDDIRTTNATADSQMARFDFVVRNKDTSSAHDFKINLMFYPDTSVLLNMGGGETRYSASGNLLYTVSRDQPAAANTNPLSLYQSNEGRILKGDTEDYTVWLYIGQSTATSVVWDWTITIDDRD